MPMGHRETLRFIQSQDPDGQATEPSDEDYNQFKAWVIATYGEAMWQEYTGSNWDERSME